LVASCKLNNYYAIKITRANRHGQSGGNNGRQR
jgi:hypothetical protein